MGTIISDIKDDLQKLEELKRKIAEIKQELASINGVADRANFNSLNAKLQETNREYKSLSRSVANANKEVVASSLSITKALTAIGGLTALKALASQVISVRGEFQKADTAIQTMLGSKEKADKLLSQVREYAKISPLEFGDITRATQMMLGFNIEAQKVPGFIKAIGDVSMGESGRFNSLTLAFSQMSATGKLMGQDLNQMINAGFNPLSVMAEKTGKSIGQLKEEMSKGAITAEMVQQAFIDATSAGGKFFGMSENAAKTINGQISMLHDAMDSIFNEIGTKSEGYIIKSLSGITSLVENYEKVARVITGLVATYGVYKTALILTTEAEKGYTVAQTLSIKAGIVAEKVQSALNATILKNPYVIAAVALGGLVTAMLSLGTEQERINAAYDEYDKKKAEIIKKENEHRERIEELARIAGDESLSTDARRKALVELEMKYPAIFAKYDTEAEKLKHIRDLKAEIAALDGKNSISNANNELESVNKRIQELEKKGGWSLASTNSYAGTSSSGRTRKEEEELKALQRRRTELSNEIKKDEGKTYLTNLTGVSNADLAKQLKERKSLIAKMEVSGKKLGNVKNGGAAGVYTKDELQGQIQIIEAEQNRRKKVLENSTKDFVADAKKAYKKEEEALKELASLTDPKKRAKSSLVIDEKKVSEMSGDEFLAAIKKQQTAVDDAKKKIDAYDKARNGSTSNKAIAEAKRQAEAQQKMAELLDKQKREQVRSAEDMQFQTSEAEIKAMSDGTDKTVKQIELEYNKELAAIRRSYEDLKLARIEEAKKLWEADPKNGGKNFFESGTYKNTNWDATYTADEDRNKAAREKAAAAARNRQLKELQKEQQQYLYDYLKEYGSIQQQREAITKEYDQKISDTQNAIQREALEQQKQQALAALDFRELQKSMDWERVFGDLDRYSTSALKELKAKLREALDAKDITVENAKILAEKINELEDRIITRSDAWASFLPILRERKKLTEEAVSAEQAYQRALSKQVEAQDRANVLKMGAQRVLSGNGMDASDTSLKHLQELLKNLDPATDAFKQLTPIVDELSAAEVNLTAATDEAAKAQRAKASIDGQLKDFNSLKQSYKKGVENAGGEIQWALQQTQELNELIDAIGLHDTEFGRGVAEFTDGTSHFASAIQKFQTGDFVGATTDAIKGIQDYGHLIERIGGFSFNGSNEKEVAKTTERLVRANEALADRISDFTDAIDKSTGTKAVEAAQSALDAQKELQANNLELLREQMGYHSAHHSNVYYTDNAEIERRYNEAKGRLAKIDSAFANYNVASLEDVYKLIEKDPAYLKTIKDYAPDLWQYLTTVGKYDKSDYWENVVSQAGVALQITEKINNNLTQTSFDSLRNSYLDTLTDMESSSEDFAKSFENMMFRAVMNSMVLDEEFNDWLRNWQENYARAMTKNDLEELERLRIEAQDKRDEKIAERDRVAQTMGYTSASISDQSAAAIAAEKITYEQADQIEGQLTAIQISGEHRNELLGKIYDVLGIMAAGGVPSTVATNSSIAAMDVGLQDVTSDMRDLIAMSYLELVEIRDNTGAIVRPIRQMQVDIAEMRADIHDKL